MMSLAMTTTEYLFQVNNRIALANKLREWDCVRGTTAYEEIGKIFGIKDMYSPEREWTEEHNDLCLKLLGPHGWTLFKVLKARQK